DLHLMTTMWKVILLFCLQLCKSTAESTARPSIFFPFVSCWYFRIYMVTIPHHIHGGTVEKVCAHLLQPNETITFTINLLMERRNLILLEETIKEKDFYKCFEFQVPMSNEFVGHIEVRLRGNSFEVKNKKKVLITPIQSMTFIQTDNSYYNYYFVLEMWLNISTNSGIVDLSYPTTSEAPLGKYILNAWQEQEITHQYTFPFTLVGIRLSQITPDTLLHLLHPACTLFFTSLPHSPLLCAVDPKYLNSSTSSNSTPFILTIPLTTISFTHMNSVFMALQALSVYAAQTFKPNGSGTVTISSAQGFQTQFHLDQINRLLYQEKALLEIPGIYSIQAQGDACSFVQVSVFNPLHIDIVSHCVLILFRYDGNRDRTNMVIVNVKLLSGYDVDGVSISMVSVVQFRHAFKSHGMYYCIVLCFLQLLKRTPLTLQFTIQEGIAVKNIKPATVRIYDYYQTSKPLITSNANPSSFCLFLNIHTTLFGLIVA
uniref:Alpha-macroglobulin receptor-binding domain-containing protein n=1 Tax=Erpetoichthys calabaricus TaxID=27687 RepID=A0A8C4SUY0_ERPCA